MDRENRFFLINQNMTDSGAKGLRKEKDCLNGLIKHGMMEVSTRTNSADRESSDGKTAESM
jgi:hypothetical protein